MTDSHKPPQNLDIADFGFESSNQLRYATACYLQHLSRLGIRVLPASEDAAAIIQRLQLASDSEAPAAEPDKPPQLVVPAASLPKSTYPAGPVNSTQPQPQVTPTSVSSVSRLPQPAMLSQPASTQVNLGVRTPFSLPVLSVDQREETLAVARQQVAACRACPELVIGRKNTVYGEGSVQPRVCFLGEAPGADEDRLGKPFVGPAGQLLTKMIQACTFKREDCYILNTIKCRPPGNRNPNPDEISNCRGYFEHQLEVLRPEYIVCLGLVAAQSLLQTTLPVGRLRGTFHMYKESKVVVTYHPAYLLRNQEVKKAAWDDLQMLMKDMGIDPKASKKAN